MHIYRSPAPNDTPLHTLPAPGEYSVGGRTTPIIVLALAPRGEVRILDLDGTIRTVAEHRIRLVRQMAS